MSRRWVIVGLLIAGAAVAAGAMAARSAGRSSPPEVEVLSTPEGFCEEFAAHRYLDQVDDVRETRPPELRAKVASVRASYLRRTASIEGPGDVASLLRKVAAALEEASTSGDATAAADGAALLDALAEERC